MNINASGGWGRRLLLSACLAATFTCPAWATPHSSEVAGIQLPNRIRIAGQDLILNGAGLRRILLMKVYVAALYLPEPQHDARAILDGDIPRRLQLTLLHDLSTDQNLDALKGGLVANNNRAELESIRQEVDHFLAYIKALHELPAGTIIQLDYLPAAGTRLSVDSRYMGTIPGEAFYRAVLKIWLGEDPVQTGLKQALLGKI